MPTATAENARIAVAANFARTAHDLLKLFKSETGADLSISIGSTGQLYAQIVNGAPFDVFLAADSERPLKAEQDGLSVPGSRFSYALGRLVFLAAPNRPHRAPTAIHSEAIIAIANPNTAPYGKAAIDALTHLEVAENMAGRLVQGISVAQTYQFVMSGNADYGFVAQSQVIERTDQTYWTVPQTAHSLIRQDAVLLKKAEKNAAAIAFLTFLRSDTARQLISERGYDLPPREGH